jgi:hypothetical protein
MPSRLLASGLPTDFSVPARAVSGDSTTLLPFTGAKPEQLFPVTLTQVCTPTNEPAFNHYPVSILVQIYFSCEGRGELVSQLNTEVSTPILKAFIFIWCRGTSNGIRSFLAHHSWVCHPKRPSEPFRILRWRAIKSFRSAWFTKLFD